MACAGWNCCRTNFTVQHRLTSDVALEAAYVGNVGRHLTKEINVNQAVPGPGDYNPRRPFAKFGLSQGIIQVCNCDNSSYNGLQTRLTKQFSRSLDFNLTYTWSKAMTNTEVGNAGNVYDIRADHAPASWDREHVVTLQHNWDLPFGRNRHWTLGDNRIADAVLGGWRLSGVHTFESGFRNGTAGRNSLRGPSLASSDFSLAKNLLVGERRVLELRADAFNVFNHVNLGNPNATIDQSGAGQITCAQTAMRQMQFGLHFQF
jgi:hypothetical protein